MTPSPTADTAALIVAMAAVRVVVIGDLMLDRFVSGHIDRISPEAPVPVFSLDGEMNMPGGACNVARNLAHLGCQVDLVGVTGRDDDAVTLKNAIKNEPMIRLHAISDTSRPTTLKTRFTAVGQQVLRVDHETTTPVSASIADGLLKQVDHCLARADILVLSDYNKGVITPDIAKKLIAMARKAKTTVLVDPKKINADVFARANIITPNLSEMRAITGQSLQTHASISAAAIAMANANRIDHVLTTMSGDGMMLSSRKGEFFHVPTQAKTVFDVSGAGDTVIAVMAAAIAAGGAAIEAMQIANTAASAVVGKTGTATVMPGEILAKTAEPMLTSRQENLDLIRAWHKDGAMIGFTNGCFDLLHPGHLKMLEAATKTCDKLVVGLNSDASTKHLKGPSRPFQPESVRAAVLASLPMVDAVIIFDENTPAKLIQAVQPDRLIKGSDYDPKKVVGRTTVLKRGGKVVTVPLHEGYSTTRLGSS
jgi:D-beta-D-heptose 7-phosphate kinase/D-beta-D-heptose 1-phosphate adenosyltransferase